MNKVLLYKTKFLGYSETFIKEQVISLKNWHGVLVGLNRPGTGLDLTGLEVHELGDLKRTRWQRFRWNLGRHFDLAPPGVVERLSRQRAQLVHVHFGTEAAHFWPVAEKLKLPVLVTLHGFDINIYREWWESGKGGSWMSRYPQRLLRMAQSSRVKFIAVSDAIKDSAIRFGIPPEKIIVRHTGIDIRKFQPGNIPIEGRPHRILFVGRLVEKKGVAHLIKAFANVRTNVPAAELVIVGDGPLREQLAKLATDLGCPVNFLGAVEPDEVKRQMDQARALCLPSITAANGDAEGFGMVILEAQACGVPVITSSRSGAQTGMVDGKTGFFHGEGDVDAMAQCMTRLLTDDQLSRQFSAAARDHVERHFDIRECTKLLEQTYDDVCSEGPTFH